MNVKGPDSCKVWFWSSFCRGWMENLKKRQHSLGNNVLGVQKRDTAGGGI